MDATSAIECDSQPQVLVASIRFSFSSFSFPNIFLVLYVLHTDFGTPKYKKCVLVSIFWLLKSFGGTEIWLRLWTWNGLIDGNMDKTVLKIVKFTSLEAFQYFGPGLSL